MTKEEYNKRLRQVDYLETVFYRFNTLRLAFIRFNEIWQQDHVFDIDLNNYLVTMYPFDKSFDDLLIDFAYWYGDGATKIVRSKRDIISTLPHHNELEEPAPYYTKKEAKGKFVCAVKLTNKTDCVRYHLRADRKDGWPVLYDSIEEAEADHFFDPLTDTVVPAVEFREDGISIVKEP
jgi:hypothetical protein